MKLYERCNPSNNNVREVAKTTSTKAKDVVQSASSNISNSTQDTIASAKDTLQSTYAQVEKSMKLGWDKTLTWLTLGTGVVSTLLQRNMQKAQKNMQKVQGPLQSNVKAGLAKTSNVLDKSTSIATDSLKQATAKAKEMQDALQDFSTERQRKRKRAKSVFRWGLIFGVLLALLYSPMTGSEARQRISESCQQYYSNFRNRRIGTAS